MKSTDLMIYHDIFTQRFSKEEIKEFLYSYESCIKQTFYKSLKNDVTANSPREFLKTWEEKFINRTDLLNEILLVLTPKEVYAILQMCEN